MIADFLLMSDYLTKVLPIFLTDMNSKMRTAM